MSKIKLEKEGDGQTFIYPNEEGNGVTISQDEMRIISEDYHEIYDALVDRAFKRFNKEMNIQLSSSKVIIRYSLIPIVNVFLDRLIRLNSFLNSNGFNYEVSIGKNYKTFETVSEFRKLAERDPEFNDEIISFLGSKLWKLRKSDEFSNTNKKNNPPKGHNKLSRIYVRNLYNGISFRIKLLLSSIKRGKIPAFGVAYNKAPLIKYLFYYKFLDDLKLDWKDKGGIVDSKIRSYVFIDDIFECSILSKFYRKHRINLNDKDISQALCFFVKKYYPIDSLESFNYNMFSAKSVLKKYNSKYVISRGGGAKGKYIIAGANEMGIKVIGIQHGGYYGYISDMHQAVEYEYKLSDIFISWGWDELPKYKRFKDLKVVKLPSPWLSERKKYWKKVVPSFSSRKQYDVLYMPGGNVRFPRSLRGSSGPRIDLIHKMSLEIKDAVKSLVENDIKVLLKPYNYQSMVLMSNMFSSLSKKYDEKKYKVIKKIDKGFDEELLKHSNLILWNQPGTGFLECISAQIPTMVFWTRLSTEEEGWARDIFEKLEKVGIVHSNTTTLVKEIKIFKKYPKKWVSDPERVSTINEFCFQYARTDKNWEKKWKDFFLSIN